MIKPTPLPFYRQVNLYASIANFFSISHGNTVTFFTINITRLVLSLINFVSGKKNKSKIEIVMH